MRASLAALLLCLAAAAPSQAGKLDLDLKSVTPTPARRESKAPPPPPVEWKPGDPRHLHGAGPVERRITHAGYLGMSVAGIVTCAVAAPAAAVGFGLIAAYQAWAWAHEERRPS